MSLIELLKQKKEELLKTASKDFEFHTSLKDHPVEGNGIYRLYYMDFHRNGEHYGKTKANIGVIDSPFSPFLLPEGMSQEDAFKVLSYLSDYLERELEIDPYSYRSVRTLDDMIRIERLGFRRPNELSPTTEPVDLFTISGRVALFKRTPQYEKYFEWYRDGVTKEEVKRIYEKIGEDFEDLIPVCKCERKPFQFIKA